MILFHSLFRDIKFSFQKLKISSHCTSNWVCLRMCSRIRDARCWFYLTVIVAATGLCLLSQEQAYDVLMYSYKFEWTNILKIWTYCNKEFNSGFGYAKNKKNQNEFESFIFVIIFH